MAEAQAESKLDAAALKKVGMIQQRQKDFFTMRLRAVGGDLTAEQLAKIAEVAGCYGRGEVHLSTRQGVEIPFVAPANLEPARAELAAAGIEMGACGPRVRVVVACPGNATCKWGIIDTKEIARELDARYFRQDTPHKFQLAVTGCPHNCAKATENDIGVMGGILPQWEREDCTQCDLCVSVCPTGAISEAGGEYRLDESKCLYCSICTSLCPTGSWRVARQGYSLFIGGTMGKKPRLADRLNALIATREELLALVEKVLRYYQKVGRKKERFGHTLDRIGADRAKEEILHGTEDR